MARRRRRGGTRSDRVKGTYCGHPRGFGFVVPEGGGADLFVPPKQEGDAIDGDTVMVKPGERGTARVERVVERGRRIIAGTYVGRGAFMPDAHHIPRILPVEGEAVKGDKVIVAATPERLRIRRVLGRAGDPEVEDAAVLAELEISPVFPDPVLAAAGRLRPPDGSDFRHRMDLRHTTTVVTIDPVTSRDFDDAISLERRGDEWLLGVHIADVSHYVEPGGPIDREARRRGTSVYLPNRVIPMLPEELSDDLCSLREGVDRLTMSVLMRYTSRGRLLETTFAESVIRSDRRLSYERASRVMDRTARERGAVGHLLRDMAKLAGILRRGRPSLDVPRQEIELVFNGQGDVVDLRPTAQDVAHGVIEEFMLAANREVARLMLRRGTATLFRHHPEPADISGLRATLEQLGVRVDPKGGLRQAMARAVKEGYGPTVASSMLRAMPRAIYSTELPTHFSLGFEAYLHFTSPIRRYADLTVHRHLRAMLRRGGGPIQARPERSRPPEPARDPELAGLAEHVTARSAAADRAESRIRRRRVLEFLLRLGSVPTEGQVTMVIERGVLVELTEYGTSGFLAADQFQGRSFRLGDTLDVCIHRIDPAAGQLDLALAPRY